MTDPDIITGFSTPPAWSNLPRATPVSAAMEPLEQRVRRLEDAVAELQDTRQLEERVVQRVAERVGANHVGDPPAQPTVLIEASRRLLPAAAGLVSSDAPEPAAEARRMGFRALYDACADLRDIVRMFCDRRYRASWLARMLPLAALAVGFLSWLLLSGIWVVGPWFDRAVDLLLAFFVYKVLSREASQYRQAIGRVSARR